MAATFASYVLTQNLAITATITHMLLYNFDDLKSAWSFMSLATLKNMTKLSFWQFWKPAMPSSEQEMEDLDPHYRQMLSYQECPDWWYGLVFLLSGVIGLVCIYKADSGMSWWAFIIATLLAAILILFVGAQSGLTGFQLHVQPIIQMIGAYLEPGNPLTNMYFTLFGYNSVGQGMLLLQDLKLGQYAKLSPRCTFTMQMVGTLVGAILNYFITISITTNQREILLSIEGTHIWSGAVRIISNTSQDVPKLTYPGSPILQHPSHNLGRTSLTHVLLGQHIRMGTTRSRPWICRSPPLLHPSSSLSKIPFRLYKHLNNILAYRMDGNRNQLCDLYLLHRGLLVTILSSKMETRMVSKVQLCAVCGSGRRNTSHCVYHDFCTLWRQWEARCVS